MQSDGSNITNITNTPSEYEMHPSWSKDGKKLLYNKFTGTGINKCYIYDIITHNSVLVDSVLTANWNYTK